MDQTRIEKEKTIIIDGLSKMAPPIIQSCSTIKSENELTTGNKTSKNSY